ncbi:RES family NAD+ phosphorylase [Rhodococcus sp. WAY2]|uniref:RES family NAD+ phosphorylase n=1 Tax=Rhodococcus sp. WAY2 TaxID=2663121 RepID=UPI001F1BA900|nr:RES family NAD+ phosphorylase [Rhodococcus sp. WAY2]
MFYGGDSYDTALAEISAHRKTTHALVGKFRTVKDNMVINLSRLPELPSSFNGDAREEYYMISFLRQFAEDLAQPIVLDGREHIDYVPTQIFTEYLRLETAYPVHGLVFNSTQCPGKNTVLFCGLDACANDGSTIPDTIELVLEAGSVRDIEVPRTPSTT